MAGGREEGMAPRNIKEMELKGLIHVTIFNEHLLSGRQCARCQEYSRKQDI